MWLVFAFLENMRITNFSVLDKEFIHIYDSDISGKKLCQKPSLRTGLVWRAWDASKTHWKVTLGYKRKDKMTFDQTGTEKFGVLKILSLCLRNSFQHPFHYNIFMG